MDRPGVPRLRVLYSFPHPLGAPGIGTTALHQVLGLIEEGHDVSVVCTSSRQPVAGARRVVETLRLAGRRIPHRVFGLERAWALHDLLVARRLRREARAFDVVHVWPLAAWRTLTAARASGVAGAREVPNTHTAHAYEVVRAENERLGLAQAKGHSHTASAARLRTELREYELADVLLVPSEPVAESFVARGIPRERLGRHRYGCDLARFVPDSAPRPPGRPLAAAFVGSGEPRKGLHFALEAWSKAGLGAAGGRLRICGAIDPAYRRFLGRLLEQPGVEALGFVGDPSELLRHSDVLLVPSLEEGSALVTYEAQAAGCVLLASREAGADCHHDVHGLLHPGGDVPALADQLMRVAGDAALLARLRAASLARREQLGWRYAARRLAACYAQAIERSSNRATPTGV